MTLPPLRLPTPRLPLRGLASLVVVALLLVPPSVISLEGSARAPLPRAGPTGSLPASTSPTGPAITSTPHARTVYVWTNRTGGPSPSRREGPAMAYDPDLSEVILFGGWNGTDIYNDTWAYKDGSWFQLDLPHAPPPLWGSGMVWDPTDNYLLLFGGWNFSARSNETWMFKGDNWTQLHPMVSPEARNIPGMVWDSEDGYVLLFAGIGITEWLNDTWTYLGGNWTQNHFPNDPPWRGGPSMADDPDDGYVALTNGESTQEYQDLWTYRAGIWTNRTAAAGGSSAIDRHRDGAVMEWDPAAGYDIVTLGESLGAYLNISSEFLHGVFTPLPSIVAPPGVQYAGAAYDAAEGFLLVFAGANGSKLTNQTWAWSLPNPMTPVITMPVPPLWVDQAATFHGWARQGDPPYTIRWQFGDGKTANGSIVSHAYNYPGDYEVNVSIEDNSSAFLNQSSSLLVVWGNVNGPLRASSSIATTVGTGRLLNDTFRGRATGGFPAYTPLWTFGDGTTADTWNLTHNYTAPGTYRAVLLVTDRSGETNSTVSLVTVLPYPVPIPPLLASLSATPVNGTVPLTVAFSAHVTQGIGPFSYSWTFGDGGSYSPGSVSSPYDNTSHTFSSAGTGPDHRWLVELVISNATNSTTRTLEITVEPQNTSTTSTPPGLFGLPGDEGIGLVGVAIALLVVVVVMLVFVRRKRSAPPPEAGYEGPAYAGPEYPTGAEPGYEPTER